MIAAGAAMVAGLGVAAAVLAVEMQVGRGGRATGAVRPGADFDAAIGIPVRVIYFSARPSDGLRDEERDQEGARRFRKS